MIPMRISPLGLLLSLAPLPAVVLVSSCSSSPESGPTIPTTSEISLRVAGFMKTEGIT